MDDSPIQTALCVIGHPIGGNPTQFVAQRALATMGLDWQFMSFDVAESEIEKAIGGVDSLGFCGAMIASPYQKQVAKILSSVRGDSIAPPVVEVSDAAVARPTSWHDCLSRDEKNKLVASNVYAEALRRIIDSHLASIDGDLSRCVVIGDSGTLMSTVAPFIELIPENSLYVVGSQLVAWAPSSNSSSRALKSDAPPETATMESAINHDIDSTATLVILALNTKPTKKPSVKASPQTPSPEFVAELMTSLPAKSLVIDLSGTANQWLAARKDLHDEFPLSVISNTELEVHRLAIAIRRWTGHETNLETLREAIEEYLEI